MAQTAADVPGAGSGELAAEHRDAKVQNHALVGVETRKGSASVATLARTRYSSNVAVIPNVAGPTV